MTDRHTEWQTDRPVLITSALAEVTTHATENSTSPAVNNNNETVTCDDVEGKLRVDVQRRIADIASSIASSRPLTEPTARVACQSQTSQCRPNRRCGKPPRPHQYFTHWHDWSSSAPAAHGHQHWWASQASARQVRASGDRRTNAQTNRQTNRRTSPSWPGTMTQLFHAAILITAQRGPQSPSHSVLEHALISRRNDVLIKVTLSCQRQCRGTVTRGYVSRTWRQKRQGHNTSQDDAKNVLWLTNWHSLTRWKRCPTKFHMNYSLHG